MFKMSITSQQEVCRVLIALIEEWGNERISIQLPESWKLLGADPLMGVVQTQFSTIHSINICVDEGKLLYRSFDCSKV